MRKQKKPSTETYSRVSCMNMLICSPNWLKPILGESQSTWKQSWSLNCRKILNWVPCIKPIFPFIKLSGTSSWWFSTHVENTSFNYYREKIPSQKCTFSLFRPTVIFVDSTCRILALKNFLLDSGDSMFSWFI